MSTINDHLVSESERYLSALYSDKLPGNIIYHNFENALRVRKYAETIGQQSGLSPEEMNILRICALFRDAGYISSYENHREESIKMTTAFLAAQGIEQQHIDHVTGVIRSSQPPHKPESMLAQVLCDASMMFIAEDNGTRLFDLVLDEMEMNRPAPVNKKALEKEFLKILTQHIYFTEYGQTVLQPKKEVNVKHISDRLKWNKLLENNTLGKEEISYSRGVETMFRITARNQINLNSIADNKSNILISVNAIIISIIITMLAGNIANMTHNIIPVLVFLVSCLVTIIIAILSTRPNIVRTKFTDEDLKNKKVDLIFFGNFDSMDYDDYLERVKEMMKDDDHLYTTLIKNQYSLGLILSKKFKLIRIAYNVFMTGIIITVLTFLVNFLIKGSIA
jgi:hypothetical protein